MSWVQVLQGVNFMCFFILFLEKHISTKFKLLGAYVVKKPSLLYSEQIKGRLRFLFLKQHHMLRVLHFVHCCINVCFAVIVISPGDRSWCCEKAPVLGEKSCLLWQPSVVYDDCEATLTLVATLSTQTIHNSPSPTLPNCAASTEGELWYNPLTKLK